MKTLREYINMIDENEALSIGDPIMQEDEDDIEEDVVGKKLSSTKTKKPTGAYAQKRNPDTGDWENIPEKPDKAGIYPDGSMKV